MFAFTYAAALLSTVFTVFAAAFFIYRRSALEASLASYLLSGALWIGGNVIADISYTAPVLLAASQLAFFGGILNLFCFVLLIDILADGKRPSNPRILLYGLPALALALSGFTAYGITGMAFPVGAPAQIIPGPVYTIALFFYLAGLIYGAIRIYRKLANEEDAQLRKQLSFVFAGLLITITGQAVFDVLLPLTGELRFYTLGPVSSVFFAAGCAYAIMRHKFIDMRLIVRMLEAKVEERTREIRALQEEQRRMIVDLSHNLQTPLAILKTKVERLRKTMIHDAELVTLEQSVDTLSNFIYDLMSLANLDQALLLEERVPFSLSRLVEEIAEEVGVIAEQEGVTVRSDVARDIIVVANEKRIREAVMNLASNALKYIGTVGPREMRLTLESEETVAVLTVADTGIGIPDKDLPHIFERFYRGNARIYGAAPGTGLGLSITERIVKDHGGAIEVESEVGKGTTFTLRLPLQERS